jgi:hypothetical protein
MAGASYVIPSFLGGEISQFAQGRYDKPDYRISMRVCLNAFALEAGPWTRRPGTRNAGTTLNGAPGRVMRFDFEQAQPYTVEFTDGKLRTRAGVKVVGPTLDTPYITGTWANVRAVQAETTDILLHPSVAPQALTVTTLPVGATPAAFALNPAIFNDGPYLDPFTNGVQAVPSATVGIISLLLQFPTWSATKAYPKGAFVTFAGVNSISLVDQNVGHSPDISPTFWAPTTAGAAINDGKGFLGSDVGRLVRLLSEPAIWDVATVYATGNVISYNPSGTPGASTNWQALANNTGKAPGSDLTNWQIVPQGASVWTWGKITSLANTIDRALAGSANFGDMTGGGGLAAAFNGVYSQVSGSCAAGSYTGGAAFSGQIILQSSYVGKDYSAASDQKILQATVYPSNNNGFAGGTYTLASSGFLPGAVQSFAPIITLNLRGKATPPTSSSDGTLLGTTSAFANSTAPVTVNSTDTATAWKYVWIEQITQMQIGGSISATSYFFTTTIAQVSLFNPLGAGSTSGVNVQILGPPLLRTAPILTWRIGAYSDTTGYPSCGVYFEGRIWLGGAIANRFDGCVSNGISGSTLNFAPTDQYGVVSTNSAISYTLNSDSVNPMLWMKGDLQGIKIGTQKSEWLAQAPTSGPIAANNIAARQVSEIGSANIEPRATEHTLVFVKRFARKLIEYFADANFNKLSGPNLAEKAEHIITSGIAEIAYTSAVNPMLWGRCADGSWFSITYKRDTLTTAAPPTFAAWAPHSLGSGRAVESICGGPSVGGNLDALTMVTNDPATGIRHVEILTDTPNEKTALADSWFLDDAIVPTSVVQVPATTVLPYGSLQLLGLGIHEGKTVQVFAGGLDLGDRGDNTTTFTDYVVLNGQLVVPFGDGISSGPGQGLFTADFVNSFSAIPLVVGFTYSSRGQPVRPVAQADTGARNGPGFGKLTREHRYAIQVVNSKGMAVGTSFDKLLPCLFRPDNSDFLIPVLSTFTGIHADAIDDSDSYGLTLCWEVTRPFPATVTAAGPNLDTKDQ